MGVGVAASLAGPQFSGRKNKTGDIYSFDRWNLSKWV